MDDNFMDDDFGRKPGAPRPDYDAELGQYKRFYENTPREKHIQAEEDAAQYMKHGIVREAATSTKSILIVDNPADIRRIHQAAAADAAAAAAAASAPATANASPSDTQPGASGLPDQAFAPALAGTAADPAVAPGAGGPGGSGGDPTRIAKPNSLESTLANIRYNGARQNRLVITGDPLIEKKYFERLQVNGKLFYQGGTPIITASRAESMKLLQEIAKEFPGASATHALSMKMDREGMGILGSISAGIKNNMTFGLRRHEMDIVVVGTPEVQAAKLKELGGFVAEMQQKNHVDPQAKLVADGALVVGEKGPLKLDVSRQMIDVLDIAKDKVNAFQHQRSEEQKAIREEKDAESWADLQKKRDGAGNGAEGGTGKDAPMKLNTHAQGLAVRLDKDFSDASLLHGKGKTNQLEAAGILYGMSKLKDPSEPELATLPEKERQTAIVQLAALIEKVDNKEFDKHSLGKGKGPLSEEVDKRENKDVSSIREKVREYLIMEVQRDPSFGDKAAPILKDLVERGVLTDKQSESISSSIRVAQEKEQQAEKLGAGSGADKAGENDPAKASPADTAKSKDQAAEGSPAAATAATPTPDTTAAKPAASADPKLDASRTSDAATAAATEGDRRAASTSALDAQSASPAEGAKQERVEPTLGDKVEPAAAQPGATKAAAEAQVLEAEKPQLLRDRIEALVKEGPANLTAENAHALVAELDGLRSKPLTSLDAGTGTDPTRTLVRTESLLKELESGRFGDELKAQAKDLAAPLQKWEKQDISRFNNDGSVTTLSRDDVVAGVKTGLAQWDGSSQTAQKDAPAATAVPSKDQASATPSVPVNPEKATASTTPSVNQASTPAQTAEPVAPAKPDAGPAPAPAVAVDKAPPAPVGKVDGVLDVAQGPSQAPKVDAPTVKAESAVEVKTAPAPDAAAAAAKEQAAVRMTETESAGGKLSMLMANPPNSFTNRDKSWNEENVQRAAKEVMRLDPDSVAQLSPQQRAKVVTYAAWVAENARDGKLPGFSTPEGKAQAQELVGRAEALIGKLEQGARPTPDVDKSIEKADRMVSAKIELAKEASATNQATREEAPRGSISSHAASALAKDLTHGVFQEKELREPQLKYLLKNAANLTPATTRDMDPETRAHTAVAMSHIAQKVRQGALGEFSKLPSSMQKQAHATANAAEAMLTAMGKDPAMRAELNQAYNELHAKTGAGKAGSAPQVKLDGAEKASSPTPSSTAPSAKPEPARAEKPAAPDVQSPAKSGGRSLDR